MSKTTDVLKQIVSDSQIYFVKLHNLHWNIKGPQFFSVHNATEEYYDYFAEVFDDAAERVLQLGDLPPVTVKQFLAAAKIKEFDKTDFNLKEVLQSLLDDFNYFLGLFKELSKVAGDEGDSATAAFADDKIAWLEKSIWMLKAMDA